MDSKRRTANAQRMDSIWHAHFPEFMINVICHFISSNVDTRNAKKIGTKIELRHSHDWKMHGSCQWIWGSVLFHRRSLYLSCTYTSRLRTFLLVLFDHCIKMSNQLFTSGWHFFLTIFEFSLFFSFHRPQINIQTQLNEYTQLLVALLALKLNSNDISFPF